MKPIKTVFDLKQVLARLVTEGKGHLELRVNGVAFDELKITETDITLNGTPQRLDLEGFIK